MGVPLRRCRGGSGLPPLVTAGARRPQIVVDAQAFFVDDVGEFGRDLAQTTIGIACRLELAATLA